jgi:competence protein ComEC
MNGVGHIPLVRLVAPLLLGIIAWLVAGFLFPPELFFAVYASGLLLWFGLRHLFLANMARRWVFGAIIHALLFVAGYHHAQNHYQVVRPDHFSHWHEQDGVLLLRVTEPVSEKANSYQVIGKVERIIAGSARHKVRGKLMVYLQKDSLASSVRYGDLLLLENQFQEVRPPQNPGEFNYRGFLARSNIYHQTYRRSGQWHPTGENRGNRVVASALQMREAALHNLEANHLSGREFAVVSALLLGFREYLDEDLQREFAGAGAMHILCVSGLHVGIIFLVLKTIFGFLARVRYGIFLRTFLIIALIWFYAAITGFSPSVMRASTMFSFVALGQSFRRSTNIYNTLAGSALVLVLIDPYIISRIGFQLSYLAVISIVTLQPWLYKKLYFKNYLLDKAWAIITVSIAAQLATGPLALFYFNQFPNYFLLTNLVVIPLASFIIYSALLTLFLTPVPWLGNDHGEDPLRAGLRFALIGTYH